MDTKDCYYVEALIKVDSLDQNFETRYEWIILQIEDENEESSFKKAKKYLEKHYNRSYMGGVFVNLSLVEIIAINPAIENIKNEVMEIYSIPFHDLNAFKKWRNSY